MKASEHDVELNGSDSALVAAALFALGEWPFETAGAKKLVTEEMRTEGQTLSEAVSERWRRLLEQAGLWNTGSSWTRELIAKRAALENGVSLTLAELRLAILALDAVTEEFSNNWMEFCTVVPGAVDWYAVGPQDVARLARQLEAVRDRCTGA